MLSPWPSAMLAGAGGSTWRPSDDGWVLLMPFGRNFTQPKWIEIWSAPILNIPGIPLRCWNIFFGIFFLECFGIFLARGIWYPPPRTIPGIFLALSSPYTWNIFEYIFSDCLTYLGMKYHVVCRKLQYLHRNPSRSRQPDMTAWFC